MSYVPKYILKRLVPKDGVKKVDDGIEINVVNVVSPIPASDLPGDPLDQIGVLVNDEELSREEKEKITIEVEDDKHPLAEIKEFGNIAVGTKIKFFFPTTDYDAGEEVKLGIKVDEINMTIEFT